MMRHEFEEMTGVEIKEEDYIKIETVYMYYPGIETKDQIVALYKIGMATILDLLPRAKELQEIETKMNALQIRAKELSAA